MATSSVAAALRHQLKAMELEHETMREKLSALLDKQAKEGVLLPSQKMVSPNLLDPNKDFLTKEAQKIAELQRININLTSRQSEQMQAFEHNVEQKHLKKMELLRTENERMQKKLDECRVHITGLTKALETVQAELEKEKENSSCKEKEYQTLENKYKSELEEKTKQFAQTATKLSTNKSSEDSQTILNPKEKLSLKESECTRLKKELDNSVSSKTHQDETALRDSEIKTLKLLSSEKNELNRKLQTEMVLLNKNYSQLKEENNSLIADLKKMVSENQQLSEEVDRLTQSEQRFSRKLEKKKKQILELCLSQKNEESVHYYGTSNASNLNSKSALRAEISSLSEVLNQFQNENAILQQRLTETEEETRTLSQENEIIRTQLCFSINELASIKNTSNVILSEGKKWSQECEQLREINGRLKIQNDGFQEERIVLLEQFEEAVCENARLNKLISEFRSNEANLTTKEQLLLKQKGSLETKMSVLEAQVRDFQEFKTSSEKIVIQLEEENNILSRRTELAEEEKEKVSHDVTILVKQKEDLTASIKEQQEAIQKLTEERKLLKQYLFKYESELQKLEHFCK